jgi:hypothetical protein
MPDDCAQAIGVAASAKLLNQHTQLQLVIQTAIWLRFDKSRLARMCCT